MYIYYQNSCYIMVTFKPKYKYIDVYKLPNFTILQSCYNNFIMWLISGNLLKNKMLQLKESIY